MAPSGAARERHARADTGDGTTTRYAGEWRNNKKHGKGEWTDAEGSYHGVWGDGNLTHKECRAIMVQSFGGPEVLQMGTKAIPEPQEAQIQIHLAASGVNPSDTYQRLGYLASRRWVPLFDRIELLPGCGPSTCGFRFFNNKKRWL